VLREVPRSYLPWRGREAALAGGADEVNHAAGSPNFQKVKMSTIVNERTIWDFAEQTKKQPNMPESERLMALRKIARTCPDAPPQPVT